MPILTLPSSNTINDALAFEFSTLNAVVEDVAPFPRICTLEVVELVPNPILFVVYLLH